MNDKITFPRLSAMLADRSGRSKRFSEDFLREFFALISERLEAGESVKVKGLGTFRLSRVEPRRSVDVTTGQPMEISGHSKVVFIPAKELAEAVNAPFEAFTAIEISDDADLSQIFTKDEIELQESSDEFSAEADFDVAYPESYEESKPTYQEEEEIEEEVLEEDLEDPSDLYPTIMKAEEANQPLNGIPEKESHFNDIIENENIVNEVTEKESHVNNTHENENIVNDEEENKNMVNVMPENDNPTNGMPENETSANDVPTSESHDNDMTSEAIESTEEPQETIDEEPSTNDVAEETQEEGEDLDHEVSHPKSWLRTLKISLGAAIVALIATFAVWYIFATNNFNSIFNKTSADASQTPIEGFVVGKSAEPVKTALHTPVAAADTTSDMQSSVAEEPEVPTAPSDVLVYDTISTTRYLTTMAKVHYGNYNLWPYIYEENKAILGHPDRIRPGTAIVIPKLSKYGIDPTSNADVEKAKQMGVEIYARYGKKI